MSYRTTQQQPWLEAPSVTYCIEVIVGTIMFVVVALAAAGLSLLVHYFEVCGVEVVIIYGLKLVEYLIFAVDILLFLKFLLSTLLKTWVKL